MNTQGFIAVRTVAREDSTVAARVASLDARMGAAIVALGVALRSFTREMRPALVGPVVRVRAVRGARTFSPHVGCPRAVDGKARKTGARCMYGRARGGQGR